MARWAILFAALLLLVSGCGETAPQSLTEKGLKELRSGKYELAIATCNQAIDQNPQDAAAFLYRGRAYQFRNAMGDPARAIADFSEAIRLVPDSADAYYSRAIVYRDLGQTELALADDKQARMVDGHLQEIYRKLPDPPVPSVDPEALAEELADKPPSLDPQAAGEIMPESEPDQRELYEQLKEQFEPRQAAEERETPIERYKRLSRQAAREAAQDRADELLEPPAKFGARESARSPSAQPPASLSEAPPAVEPRPARAPLSSPFQPRLPGRLSGESDQPRSSQPAFRSVQSPFGQHTPAPTGFGVQTQPANPFGPQPLAPRTVRPQPSPSSSGRYSNPAVRPDNPRDYVP